MNLRYSPIVLSLLPLLLFVSCREESIPTLSLGIRDVYYGTRLQPVSVTCGLDDGTYSWLFLGYEHNGEKLSYNEPRASSQNLVEVLNKVGTYRYRFVYQKNGESIQKDFRIVIAEEIINYSSYIADVLEYQPAPGRNVNYSLGYTNHAPSSYQDLLASCKSVICGPKINKSISLGGFGGYVVFSFDHTIINVPNVPDFEIFSNIVLTGDPAADPSKEKILSNSCPGVVWVAFDANNNGKPDEEEWYELFYPVEPSTPNPLHLLRNVSITYTRNTPSNLTGAALDSAEAREYKFVDPIRWQLTYPTQQLEAYVPTTLPKMEGFIPKLITDVDNTTAKSREYWPLWRENDKEITLKGTLLAPNGVEKWNRVTTATGEHLQVISSLWVLPGTYAHNIPATAFDISHAIDKDGNPVNLPGVQFVKVQTGVNLQLGHFGASCTEIQGARDLHMDAN